MIIKVNCYHSPKQRCPNISAQIQLIVQPQSSSDQGQLLHPNKSLGLNIFSLCAAVVCSQINVKICMP